MSAMDAVLDAVAKPPVHPTAGIDLSTDTPVGCGLDRTLSQQSRSSDTDAHLTSLPLDSTAKIGPGTPTSMADGKPTPTGDEGNGSSPVIATHVVPVAKTPEHRLPSLHQLLPPLQPSERTTSDVSTGLTDIPSTTSGSSIDVLANTAPGITRATMRSSGGSSVASAAAAAVAAVAAGVAGASSDGSDGAVPALSRKRRSSREDRVKLQAMGSFLPECVKK